MEAITAGIAEIGTYLYQAGEALVVGTYNTVSVAGDGLIALGKAIFLGTGIGG